MNARPLQLSELTAGAPAVRKGSPVFVTVRDGSESRERDMRNRSSFLLVVRLCIRRPLVLILCCYNQSAGSQQAVRSQSAVFLLSLCLLDVPVVAEVATTAPVSRFLLLFYDVSPFLTVISASSDQEAVMHKSHTRVKTMTGAYSKVSGLSCHFIA